MQWKITYFLAQAVEVESPVASYTDLGVSLLYDSDAKLTRVEHLLTTADAVSENDVFVLSQERLELFWELLHYQRGVQLDIAHRAAEPMQTDTRAIPVRTSDISYTAAASFCRVIAMPDQNIFAAPESRLVVWLRLANEARSAPDVNAIRNYYMIWEDMHCERPDIPVPPEADDLRLIRNFVSHGGILTRHDLLVFIQRELGTSVNRHDPMGKEQQVLVQKHREKARQWIEAKLINGYNSL